VKPSEQVTLWAISVDTPEQGRGFSDKIAAIDGKGGINFPLLSDPMHRTIDAYGLQDPRYLKLKREGIPYPTSYVIDRSGKVVYARTDQDWKIRPSSTELRAAIDSLK
jgi:peroxiredoxin